ALLQELPGIVHLRKDAACRPGLQDPAAALSFMRHTGRMERLRQISWDALRAEVALPAIASILRGTPAEREVERTLRAHRGLRREERRAAVEAMFGVALWRRRLRWEAGSDAPPMLLASLLRDLAGVEESRAVALSGAPLAPRRATAPPPTVADRWSLPDWLEQHLLSELGSEAEAFCAAIAVPG